jgi:CheY-like chemotaxis protein
MRASSPVPELRPIPLALIVEPDGDTCGLYALALADMVTEVLYASDGADALSIALARRPSLVITETHVPRVDGVALCKILRHDPNTAGTWLVVVTADVRPIVLAGAKAAGAHVVLSKPASADALIATISKLVENGRHSRGPDATV